MCAAVGSHRRPLPVASGSWGSPLPLAPPSSKGRGLYSVTSIPIAVTSIPNSFLSLLVVVSTHPDRTEGQGCKGIAVTSIPNSVTYFPIDFAYLQKEVSRGLKMAKKGVENGEKV